MNSRVLDRKTIRKITYIWIQIENKPTNIYWYETDFSYLVPNQIIEIKENIINSIEESTIKPNNSPCWINNIKKWIKLENNVESLFIRQNIIHEKSIIGGRLKLSSKTRYGKNSKGMKKYSFVPHINSYPTYCVASSKEPSRIDKYVRVEIFPWKDDETMPQGLLVEEFGDVNNNTIFEKALTHGYISLPRSRSKIHRNFNKKDLLNLENNSINEENWVNVPTYTIDPINCLDIDDAISYDEKKKELGIHIACPILSFSKNDELHEISMFQNETLYREKIENLMPEKIIKKHSLFENQDKDCLSVIFSKNNTRLVKTKINVTKNLTYENANNINYINIIKNSVLNIFNINKIEDTHKLIEICMIKANSYIANWLIKNRKNSLIRIAPKNSRAYYTLYDKEINIKHYSLNLSEYTHFTSPLRRFADQIVHRSILYNYEPSYLEIMNMNKSQYLRNQLESEFYLMKLFEFVNKDKEELGDLVLKGKLIDIQSNYGRIEINNKILSVPLYRNIVNDFFETTKEENYGVIYYYPNKSKYIKFELGIDFECIIKWNSNNGLEGFLYNWVNPPIQKWIKERIQN